MSTAEQREFHSVETYLELLDKSDVAYEYVNGFLRAMSGPTVRHNIIASNAVGLFWMKLKGSKCRALNSDSIVRIRNGSSTWYYFPDASIICESNSQVERFQDRPSVVVEVLSPSTRSFDLDEKVNNYLSLESLQIYLILEQDEPQAILFRRTPDGFLRESVNGLHKSFAFEFLGLTIAMSELYEGVEFPTTVVREIEPAYEPVPVSRTQ